MMEEGVDVEVFMFVIFVAQLQVPVNRAEGFTKILKFATKIIN